ncbi:MAG: ATP-binding protein [Burkholderiaceae bacterium]
MTDLHRQLVEMSPDGIVVVDARGRIIHVNARAERLFGYAEGRMVGLPLESLVPQRFRAVHDKHRAHFMGHANARSMGIGMHLTGLRRDGSEFPVEVGLAPLTDGTGHGVAAAYVRDLSPTDRGQATFKQVRYQEVVRRFSQEAFTELHLERVVQRVPQLLVEALDCEAGELLLLSRDRREFSVRAAHGVDDETREALRMPNTDRSMPGFVIDHNEPIVADDLRTETRWRVNPAILAAGYRALLAVPVQLRGQPVGVLTARSPEIKRFAHDDVSAMTAIAYLVSVVLERQQNEERLAQGQKMEALGQLTGGVAHDFNNILTVVLGNLQLLDDLLQGQARSLKYATAAARAASRGADLTRKLLAFARRQPLASRPVPVESFFRSWNELLGRTLDASIRLVTQWAEHGLVLNADPSLLETALLNLALNARDAMPGGGTLTVSAEPVSVARDDPADSRELAAGAYVLISVSDTGHGMDAEVMRHMFEPFFSTKGGRGSGLGLAMVYGFVRQSGGGIAVYSEPGRGTTFKLYLPRVTHGDIAEAGAAEPRRGGNERILLVEDDDDVRAVASSFLSQLGYRVVEVADARSALDLLERDRGVDLLFSDVVLPGGMSGPQLAQTAIARMPGLRALLASGYPRDALSGLSGDLEHVALLTKPYSRDDLARAVRRALDASY